MKDLNAFEDTYQKYPFDDLVWLSIQMACLLGQLDPADEAEEAAQSVKDQLSGNSAEALASS